MNHRHALNQDAYKDLGREKCRFSHDLLPSNYHTMLANSN